MVETAHVDVVVLCGGLGTRLSTVIADRPKPMVQIGQRPFLEIVLHHVAKHGFQRFVLCVGYKANVIKEHFSKDKKHTIVFSEEQEPLGTAGALRHCAPLLRSDVALVLNGDSFCPLDLVSFLNFHEHRGGIGSVAAVPVRDRADGGFIEIGEAGQVVAFSEKKWNGDHPRYLNAGIYVFGRKVFESIPKGQRCSLEHDVLPSLLKRGVYGYITTEMLYDIGTPERLEICRRALAQ